MSTQHYTVTGMTCQHCVNAVTDEVKELPGVRTVDVDLESGALTVTADAELTDEQITAAVDEAGYQLVS